MGGTKIMRFYLFAVALTALLSGTAAAQDQDEPVLLVAISVEQRVQGEEAPQEVRAKFLVRSGSKAEWHRERRAPAAPSSDAGEHSGIACFARAAGDGVAFELEIETGRRDQDGGLALNRFALAGKVGYGNETEVAHLETPEGEVWIVRLTCERAGALETPAAAGPGPSEAPDDRSIRLQGVMIEGDGPARAILAVGGQALEVEVGDFVPGDWEVTAIDSTGVTLRGAGGVTRKLSTALGK